MLLRTGKAGRSSSRRNTSVAFSPKRTTGGSGDKVEAY
jgi:hypothetical protein